MNPEQIAGIKESLAKITPAPWQHVDDSGWYDLDAGEIGHTVEGPSGTLWQLDPSDAEFIAKAPERISALIDEVEANKAKAITLDLLLEDLDGAGDCDVQHNAIGLAWKLRAEIAKQQR